MIIYSTTIHEHLTTLTDVIKRLQSANLKIQLHKCEFLRKKFAYLGHLLTKVHVTPNPLEVDCIINLPQPTSH